MCVLILCFCLSYHQFVEYWLATKRFWTRIVDRRVSFETVDILDDDIEPYDPPEGVDPTRSMCLKRFEN